MSGRGLGANDLPTGTGTMLHQKVVFSAQNLNTSVVQLNYTATLCLHTMHDFIGLQLNYLRMLIQHDAEDGTCGDVGHHHPQLLLVHKGAVQGHDIGMPHLCHDLSFPPDCVLQGVQCKLTPDYNEEVSASKHIAGQANVAICSDS